MFAAKTIDDLTTPSLLIDMSTMRRNICRLSDHIGALGGTLRPHVKTHKSVQVTHEIIAAGNVAGITVSTLKEAEYFFQEGITNILYGVGIAPNKLPQVCHLLRSGCELKIVLDSLDMASVVAEFGKQHDCIIPVLIELDTDGHRAGVKADSTDLISIAKKLNSSKGTKFLGLMTHAGESYHCSDEHSLVKLARQERDLSLLAAQRLEDVGIHCEIVSIGSTPTAFAVDNLDGITEVRAGVYVFFDLVMAGIGVCEVDDIAVSVLSSIIGYQKDKQWVLTDAGWMAMSRDRGTANQQEDQGYGLVTDSSGQLLDDLFVSDASQEHGILSPKNTGGTMSYDKLLLGSMVRILPNHACSTMAQYEKYYVTEGKEIIAVWDSVKGW